MQPFPKGIVNLLKGWEVRVLILLSLLLQIILTIFGARRKYRARIWIRMLVWSAYMTADSVATVVLGNISRSTTEPDSEKSYINFLHAFWAPFLLLHLGGPDTITAYSLEDNELWSRYFLELIVQVGLAFYIFVRSWSNTALTYITIPIFVTGVIKYGERTFVLRSSSSQYFKDLLLSDPNPGPDIIRFKTEYPKPRAGLSAVLNCCHLQKKDHDHQNIQMTMVPETSTLPFETESLEASTSSSSAVPPTETSKRRHAPQQHQPQNLQQANVSPIEIESLEASTSSSAAVPPTETSKRRHAPQQHQPQNHLQPANVLPPETLNPDANYLQVAYFLFKRFRYLFADLILSYYERDDSYPRIENGSAEDAFKLVAVELGWMYDELYTKATIVYTPFGILFRLINFCCIVSASISFWIVIDSHLYPPIDIFTTYVLMIGAVVIEIYAFIILLLSDRTKLCLSKERCHCHPIADRKRWSESLGQYNLISCCLQNVQPICNVIEKLPWIGKLLDKYMYLTRKDVNDHLQNIIFTQLREKSKEIKDDHFTVESCKKLLAHRGDYVLEKRCGTIRGEFRWSISDVEFDHSLLLWHIATGLCYYTENNKRELNCGISKYLSDYILYLLVFRPSMLPEGIAEIRYRDTLAECMRLFMELSIDESTACKMLLQVRFGPEEEQTKGDRSQSVLFYGCRLANRLQDLEIKNGWNRERKWEMISEVWVEMLVYVANKCTWKEHGQQLRKGGELLTHVRILMAHLGLSEQYRIQNPYFTQQRDIQRQGFTRGSIKKKIFARLFCKDHLNCRSCCTNRQSRRGIRA